MNAFFASNTISLCISKLSALSRAVRKAVLSPDSFAACTSKSTRKQIEKASSAASIEAPAVTVAIRTNGVEHRQAANYVQRLIMGVLGLEISEAKDTLRRYVVTHEDKARGLLFHPVLMEKLRKAEQGAPYGFDEYGKELAAITGKPVIPAATWGAITDGKMNKKDGKFNVYLGLRYVYARVEISSSSAVLFEENEIVRS